MKRYSLATCSFVLIWLLFQPAWSQENKITSFKVDKAFSQAVFETAQTVLAGREVRMSMDSTGNIILMGSEEDVKLVQGVIDSIRVSSEPSIRIFQLQHIQADTLVDVLGDILVGADDLKFAAKSTTNSIIVAGSRQKLDLVETVIEQLDQPNSQEKNTSQLDSCYVKFYWLTDAKDFKDDKSKHFEAPDNSLADVANWLVENGVKEPVVITSAMTLTKVKDASAKKGFSFSATSQKKISDIDTLQIFCEGTLEQAIDGKVGVSINLQLSNSSQRLNEVNSSLNIPLDHSVAFSISDTVDFKSIVVVRVEEME